MIEINGRNEKFVQLEGFRSVMIHLSYTLEIDSFVNFSICASIKGKISNSPKGKRQTENSKIRFHLKHLNSMTENEISNFT